MVDGHANGGVRPADSVAAVLESVEPSVLAIIAGVEGPSYRPFGAMMALFPDGRRVGSLSSGCIESDISLHAAEALESGATRMVRYGLGSPFIDIQLPCGGGLDILLVPRPDRDALARVQQARQARRAVTMTVGRESGAITITADGSPGLHSDRLAVRIEPEIRFLVFGKGPEAVTFAALSHSVGFPTMLLSPDAETLDSALCATSSLTSKSVPEDLAIDDRTAVVLFFHDHDWEPPLLATALRTPAFYVGAQGSRRAREAREHELRGMGVGEEAIGRLRGPIGLVPSARDPRTLAVSVLAEVLATAKPTLG